jgi:hypothetical protein
MARVTVTCLLTDPQRHTAPGWLAPGQAHGLFEPDAVGVGHQHLAREALRLRGGQYLAQAGGHAGRGGGGGRAAGQGQQKAEHGR